MFVDHLAQGIAFLRVHGAEFQFVCFLSVSGEVDLGPVKNVFQHLKLMVLLLEQLLEKDAVVAYLPILL